MENNNKNIWLLSTIGFITLLFMGYFALSLPFNDGSGNMVSNLFAEYGDFIGGTLGTLLTFGTIIFLILQNKSQREQYEEQKIMLRKELKQNEFKTMIENYYFLIRDLNEYVETANKHLKNLGHGNSDVFYIALSGLVFGHYGNIKKTNPKPDEILEYVCITQILNSKFYSHYHNFLIKLDTIEKLAIEIMKLQDEINSTLKINFIKILSSNLNNYQKLIVYILRDIKEYEYCKKLIYEHKIFEAIEIYNFFDDKTISNYMITDIYKNENNSQ